MSYSFNRRLKNFTTWYALAAMLSVILALNFSHPAFTASALHMVIPGLGTSAAFSTEMAKILAPILAFLFIACAAVIWLATGNIVLLIVVWTSIGLASALLAQASTEPLILSSIGLLAFTGFAFALNPPRRKSPVAKEKCAADKMPYSRFQTLHQKPCQPEQLNFLRIRANQPISEFNGYDQIEQFQTSSLRYQNAFMGYALAVSAEKSDRFHSHEQKSLIQKQFESRVWNYWKLENMWGNLRTDGNPLQQGNIMYSGFLALQIELYTKTTGDHFFDQPSSITLTNQKHEWHSQQSRLIECLASQYSRSQSGFLTCEPNWAYPICNFITACAIKSYDQRSGTKYWENIAPRFFKCLDVNFTKPNGGLIAARSTHTGIAVPNLAGPVSDAFACLFLNALDPCRASKLWNRLRNDILDKPISKVFTPIDIGNYQMSFAASLATAGAAAAELNDAEVLDIIIDNYEKRYPLIMKNDIAYRRRVSVWSHAMEVLMRENKGDAIRKKVMQGH